MICSTGKRPLGPAKAESTVRELGGQVYLCAECGFMHHATHSYGVRMRRCIDPRDVKRSTGETRAVRRNKDNRIRRRDKRRSGSEE